MKKLFLIEFGNPDPHGWNCSTKESIYVIADNYEESVAKAMIFMEGKSEKRSVVDYDGSLNLNSLEIKIKAIKLISEEVVI